MPETQIVDPTYADREPEQDTMNLDTPDVEPMLDDFSRLVGIPEQLAQQWKDKYGVVFRLWFLQEQYIYRNFTYYEYKHLRKRIREEYKDNVEAGDEAFKEEVQKMCVLWPQDYASRMESGKPRPLPGGIPFLIGDYILAASGFTEIIPDIISNDNQ